MSAAEKCNFFGRLGVTEVVRSISVDSSSRTALNGTEGGSGFCNGENSNSDFDVVWYTINQSSGGIEVKD